MFLLIAIAISNIIINNNYKFPEALGLSVYIYIYIYKFEKRKLNNISRLVHNCSEDKQLCKCQTHY